MLLVPRLACRPRSRRIFRFVKSIKMPVMNIFLQLRVCFNMLFASGEKQALMQSAGGERGGGRGGVPERVYRLKPRQNTPGCQCDG